MPALLGITKASSNQVYGNKPQLMCPVFDTLFKVLGHKSY
jgi:hypothetical protein